MAVRRIQNTGNCVQKSVYCENGKIHLDANNRREPAARQHRAINKL